MSQMQKLMQMYNQQALLAFTGKSPNSWEMPGYASDVTNKEMLEKAVGNQNEAGLYYSEGGFFVDCCLEAPIMNATLQPIYGLANMIPVFATGDRKIVFGYVTEITEPTGAYPDAPCDDDPQVGDPNFCKAEFEIGRISYQTKTLELDTLIEKACRGVREDFYLIGNVRGVSAIPTQTQLNDRDFVARAAVRRQMQLVTRSLQRDLLKQFWTGDPTNVAVNTVGGGRKEFWGLMNLIADDYDTKSFVTGTNCAALNSDVKTFTGCVGDGTNSLWDKLQTLEDTIYNRAALMGLLPYDAVLVMHPVIWSQIVKVLPCEIMGDGCVRPSVPAVNGTVINLDGGVSQTFLRNQMQTSMRIEINGRMYDVVLDSSLPVVQGGVPGNVTYTGSIFYVPLRVAGESVLYWRHKDYTRISEQLRPIPATQFDMAGWSDGGRFHSIIEHKRRCFVVSTKAELGLVFTAPMLAGRIDEVCVNRNQQYPMPS